MEATWNNYILVRKYINDDDHTPSLRPEDSVGKIDSTQSEYEIDEETSRLPIDIKVLFHEFFMAGLEAVKKAVDSQVVAQLYDFLYNTVHLCQEIPSAHHTAESSTPQPTSDPGTLAVQLMHQKWQRVERHCINEDQVITQVRKRLSHLLGDCTVEKYCCIQATIKAETNSKARELAAKLFGSHFPLYSVSEAIHDCIDEHLKEALENEESNKLLGDDKDLILEMMKMLKQFTEITLKANLGDILDGTSFTAEFMVSSECRHTDIKFKDTSELERQLKIKLEDDPSCLSKVLSLTERTGKRTREEQQDSEAEEPTGKRKREEQQEPKGLGKEELRVIERLKKEDVTRQEKVEQWRKDGAEVVSRSIVKLPMKVAGAMPAALKPDASPQLIDKLFKSTPAQLIPKLAATIKSWLTDDKGDVNKLRLVDRNLSQEDILNLLMMAVPSESDRHDGIPEVVVHMLAFCSKDSLLNALLRRIESPDNFTSISSAIDTKLESTFLNYAMEKNKHAVFDLLLEPLNERVRFYLLCEENRLRRTTLHWLVFWNQSIDPVRLLIKDKALMHNLLSIRDEDGRTPLTYSIFRSCEVGFKSILALYVDNHSGLLDLVAILDNNDKTSFHYAAGQENTNYLVNLIKATLTSEATTRRRLSDLLSISDSDKVFGENVQACHLYNPWIYKWALESLIKSRYLIFDLPSVLVMYNTTVIDRYDHEKLDREDALTEANSLINCFKDIGLKLDQTNKFTKRELFEAIRKQQTSPESRNGQIVALMSHGYEGYIQDVEGILIPLQEIEAEMCPPSHYGSPKVLILQCSQGLAPKEKRSVADAITSVHNKIKTRSYCPRHPDFCTITSTTPGISSERNKFIPLLAAAIKDSQTDDSIQKVMFMVKNHFPTTVIEEQVPGCLDWLKFDISFKNILPIYLEIKKKEKEY